MVYLFLSCIDDGVWFHAINKPLASQLVFLVFIHGGVLGAFFMIMIFLAAVLCSFIESVLIVMSSIELLNGLVLDLLSFVRFSLSHQDSRRRTRDSGIASLTSLCYFLQVKPFSFVFFT